MSDPRPRSYFDARSSMDFPEGCDPARDRRVAAIKACGGDMTKLLALSETYEMREDMCTPEVVHAALAADCQPLLRNLANHRANAPRMCAREVVDASVRHKDFKLLFHLAQNRPGLSRLVRSPGLIAAVASVAILEDSDAAFALLGEFAIAAPKQLLKFPGLMDAARKTAHASGAEMIARIQL